MTFVLDSSLPGLHEELSFLESMVSFYTSNSPSTDLVGATAVADHEEFVVSRPIARWKDGVISFWSTQEQVKQNGGYQLLSIKPINEQALAEVNWKIFRTLK
jgi:hypothetical protein